MGMNIPEQFRASFCFHNGQDLGSKLYKYCLTITEIRGSFLDASPLLSLKELVLEKLGKYKDSEYLPVSHPMGHKQFIMDLNDGSIHLISGIL